MIQAARWLGPVHALVAVRCEELPRRRTSPLAGTPRRVDGLVGCSQAMQSVLRKIDIYGPTDAPVLLTGETGTGKELVARALHARSPRRQRPFVAVNCAALSEDLLETELFGHEKGAFTSAVRPHQGRFERAHGGTLFLDEIGDLPLRLQAKLLRVLETGMVERVGGEQERAVDVRVVSATNTCLEAAVQRRTFRLDLYHRLEVLRLHMPPLRERREDIPLLVAHFLAQFNARYQRHIRGVTPEALELLQAYGWPGNVRELRNVLEHVYVETTADVIGRPAFDEWCRERARFYPSAWQLQAHQEALAMQPALLTPCAGEYSAAWPLQPPVVAPGAMINAVAHRTRRCAPQAVSPPLTRERIAWAFERAVGNLTRAARLLGVHKTTLYRYMKALGVTRGALAACGVKHHDPVSVESTNGHTA